MAVEKIKLANGRQTWGDTSNPEVIKAIEQQYNSKVVEVNGKTFATGGLTDKQQKKVGEVMHEFKEGELHSGSKTGPIVKDRKQAVAIALSEASNSPKYKKGGEITFTITKNNTEQIIRDFLRINKAPNYHGIYEKEDGYISLDYGKYGYSVSESQQETDLYELNLATTNFNNEYKGKLFAFAERGDKFNMVHIADIQYISNNRWFIDKLSKKTLTELFKAGYTQGELGIKKSEDDAKLKATNSLEKEAQMFKKKTGFETSPSEIELYKKYALRKVYPDYSLTIWGGNYNQGSKQQFKNLDELFNALESQKIVDDLKSSSKPDFKFVFYTLNDSFSVEKKSYNYDNSVSLNVQYKLLLTGKQNEIKPNQIADAYLNEIKRVKELIKEYHSPKYKTGGDINMLDDKYWKTPINPKVKEVEDKLKALGFTLSHNKYSKQIDENTFITGRYSDKENVYLIGGVKKIKTPLGENSVGINHRFENEDDFFNKIKQYDMKKAMHGAITIDAYDEENYPSYHNYLKTTISKYFGAPNIHYSSADWGGIDNWTILGDKFFGTFIIIDDNDNVVLMERVFDEPSEENIDTDLAQAEPNDTKALEILFEKANEIKNNDMSIAKKGTLTKVMESRVNEVNELIERGNEKGIEVTDKSGTWQSPMKYKPFKYSNGVLYENYEELDLYLYSKKGERKWILVKTPYTKSGDGIDTQKAILTNVARMYRNALKHFEEY
jgi:hypothetical protein